MGSTICINNKFHHAQDSNKPAQHQLPLHDQELRLVPISFFLKEHVWWQLSCMWQPMLIYGAQGAALWKAPAMPANKGLEITLGVAKAQILYALLDPASTGELAHRLNLTAGAVSQQLSRLRKAGLVESTRLKQRVYYRLTERGRKAQRSPSIAAETIPPA
jgi:DNA-binding transcriptional ArsR family regulator